MKLFPALDFTFQIQANGTILTGEIISVFRDYHIRAAVLIVLTGLSVLSGFEWLNDCAAPDVPVKISR